MLREFTASIQKQNFVPEQSGDVYDPDTRLKKEAMKKRVEARITAKKMVSEDLQNTVPDTPKNTLKIFYPYANKNKTINHANSYKQIVEAQNPGLTVELVDNKSQADMIFGRGQGMGNPFSHESSHKEVIVKTRFFDETMLMYEAWLKGEPMPEGTVSITPEQQKKLDALKAEWDNKLKPFVSSSSFETVKRYSVEDLRNNPDKIYIFGDNTEGWGKGGQAIVRDEPNAFGISTKNSPTQFMSDDNFEANKTKIDADIAAIKADGRPIVFPEDGIGTGRADLQNKAPRTWAYLQKELNKLKNGGSLGAAKLNDPNVFDELVEEYTPGSKFLDDFKSSIPGYILVPFEQMLESGLKASGYKEASKIAGKLVAWELYTFATSLGANVIGRGEGALTSPRLAQAYLLLGDEKEFKKRAENIEEDMMENSAAVGQPLMSAIIKAMPSYWLDEWLLKRNPEFAGWKEMFPQVATLKKGAEIGLGKLFGNGK
jgi:hypothetical protein